LVPTRAFGGFAPVFAPFGRIPPRWPENRRRYWLGLAIVRLTNWCESGEVHHFPISFLLTPAFNGAFCVARGRREKRNPSWRSRGRPQPRVAPFHPLDQKVAKGIESHILFNDQLQSQTDGR
jgi:hypothetical protein